MARAGEERALRREAESIGVDIPIELQADRVPPQLLGLNSYDKPSVGLQLLRAGDPRARRVRRRVPRVHPALGVQAPVARPISSAPWRTSAATGSTGSGVSSGSRTTTSTRRSTPSSSSMRGDTNKVVVGTRTARAACCRFARASRSATDRRRTSTIRPRCGARTPRATCGATRSSASTSRAIELDPDHRLIDIDRSNNVWTAPSTPPRSAPAARPRSRPRREVTVTV